jgi:hypothetical protein
VSEVGAEIQRVYGNGELRQRNVNFAGVVETAVEENASEESGVEEKQRRSEPPNGSVVTKLETAESLDWNKLMADDPNCKFNQSYLFAFWNLLLLIFFGFVLHLPVRSLFDGEVTGEVLYGRNE